MWSFPKLNAYSVQGVVKRSFQEFGFHFYKFSNLAAVDI